MKITRVLGTSAAAATMILAPQAAFASDGYGGTGTPSGSSGSVSTPSSTLPSTGSSSLDEVIGGAGLLLLLGGGATLVAARRKKAHAAA